MGGKELNENNVGLSKNDVSMRVCIRYACCGGVIAQIDVIGLPTFGTPPPTQQRTLRKNEATQGDRLANDNNIQWICSAVK